MSNFALGRIQEERKAWRKDHPPGFWAKPRMENDQQNLMIWDCGIPGPEKTDWEGATYPLTITFSPDYPTKAPTCQFPKGFFHPNVFPAGNVCLSILGSDWKPILTGIQALLKEPNNNDPAQSEAYEVYKKSKATYSKKILEQAKKYKNKD